MQMNTTVGDVMHREFLGVSESDSLREAVELMVKDGTDCLVVVRGGEPVGCLDARSALSSVLSGDVDGTTVGAVMQTAPPTVSPGDSLDAVRERLVSDGVDRVVVTVDGEAKGVVTSHDVLAVGAMRSTDPRSNVVVSSNADMDRAMDAGPTADGGITDDGTESRRTGNETYTTSTQGVCEVCGSLVPSLSTTNGQAVCPDCQAV